MSNSTVSIQAAMEQFEAINKDFLQRGSRDEVTLSKEILSVLQSMEVVDYKQHGHVEEVSEDVTLCYLHASESTLVQVNYLAPNAFYPAHDHHGFVQSLQQQFSLPQYRNTP